MKYATLAWIKPVIDDGLSVARTTLERFVENDEVAILKPVLPPLKEIHGALVILNAETAALLINEINQVLKGLLNETIPNQAVVYDSLMRALLQLPNYVDYLVLGYPDIPLALLPLINRLRQLRKQPAIHNKKLFSPDVNVNITGLRPAPRLTDKQFKQHAIQLRLAYHKGLSAWMKGKPAQGLKYLHTILLKLQQITGTAPVTRVWLIAGALIESMLQKGLPANATLVHVFKQMDVLLKRQALLGKRALHIAPPMALINTQLNLIAHSKSKGAKVTFIKHTFHLDYLFPTKAKLQVAQQAFSGPDIELIAMVVKEHIKEDMDLLQTTLDIIQRSAEVDINEIAPLIEVIQRLAYTLRLLDLESQCASLLKQARLMESIVAAKTNNNMEQLLTIALALLHVDAALETLIIHGTYTRQQVQSKSGLMQVSFNEVVKVAVEYAKKELTAMKEPIKQFINSGGHLNNELKNISQRFRRIEGLLMMLEENRANKLMRLCHKYIEKVFIQQQKVPPEPQQQALADIITSFDVYLETLAGNPMDGEHILNTTQRCLMLLR